MSDDAPSTSVLAGQLAYLFEDDSSLRDASDDDLATRLNHDDRYARAREHYPLLSDSEVRDKLDEFPARITAAAVHAARSA